jgi:hypothetical protein
LENDYVEDNDAEENDAQEVDGGFSAGEIVCR